MKDAYRLALSALSGLIFGLCLLVPGVSAASIIVINSTDSGWYNEFGDHIPSVENYTAGDFLGVDFNNWFVFDLSGVTGPFVGATLRLFSGNVTGSGTYTTYSVTTSIPTLRAGGTGLVGIYNDLESGTVYGSRVVSISERFLDLDITLNVAAITSLNAATGLWAIGGDYTTTNGFTFGGVTGSTRQLLLEDTATPGTVVEPSTLFLMGVGIAGLGIAKRRRNGQLQIP